MRSNPTYKPQEDKELERARDYFNKGIEESLSHNWESSQICFKLAAALAPGRPSILLNLAIALTRVSGHIKAQKFLRWACASDPLDDCAALLYAEALQTDGEIEAANQLFFKSYVLNPSRASCLLNIARIGGNNKLVDRASQVLENYSNDFYNIAVAYLDQQRVDLATVYLKKQIVVAPDHAKAYYNLSLVLDEYFLADEAQTHAQRSVLLQPADSVFHWHLCLIALKQGNYALGWREFEWRVKLPDAPRPPALGRGRRWSDPEQFCEIKVLLIYAEQGLGDTIFMARYVEWLSHRSIKIIFFVPTELSNVFLFNESVQVIDEFNEKSHKFSHQCSLLSLPFLLSNELPSPIESPVKLRDDHISHAKWSQRFNQQKSVLRVGLTWSSSSFFKDDYRRSLRLEMLRPLVQESRVDFISLQKSINYLDLESPLINSSVRLFHDDIVDFNDTIQLIKHCDLVITTCTSIAHLSCSLGKETWVLVSFNPDFRWQRRQCTTTWYPSAVVFRQKVRNEWTEVILKVKSALSKRVSAQHLNL